METNSELLHPSNPQQIPTNPLTNQTNGTNSSSNSQSFPPTTQLPPNPHQSQPATKPELLRGWLKKYGEGKLKGWKKRFFAQYDHRLCWFKNEEVSGSLNDMEGFLDMREVSDVFIVSENQFEIISPGHAAQFQVFVAHENGLEDSEELQFWITKIGKLIQYYHPQEDTSSTLGDEKLQKIRGWLNMQASGLLKGWKKRYFKQDGKKLFYFSSKTDKESLGYIFIPSIIEIRKNSETQFDIFLNKNEKKENEKLHRDYSNAQPLHFQILTKGEEVYDINYWVDSLDEWVSHFNETENLKFGTNIPNVVTKEESSLSEEERSPNILPVEQKEVKENNSLNNSSPNFFLEESILAEPTISVNRDTKSPFPPENETNEPVSLLETNEQYKDQNNQSVPNFLKDSLRKSGSEEKDLPQEKSTIPPIDEKNQVKVPENVAEKPNPILPSNAPEQIKSPVPSSSDNLRSEWIFILSSLVLLAFFCVLYLPFTYTLGFICGIIVTLGIFSLFFYWLFLSPPTQTPQRIIDFNSAATNHFLQQYNYASSVASLLSKDKPHHDLAETYLFIINQLLSKLLREHFHSVKFAERYKEKFNQKLKDAKKPGFIGDISITNLDLGNNVFEIVNGLKLLEPTQPGELRIAFYVKYKGDRPLRVTLQTTVFLNWPRQRFASVPVILSLSLTSLSGPMILSVPDVEDPICTIWFTSAPASEFVVDTGLGNRTNIKNIPKVSEYLVTKLKTYLDIEMVAPNGVSFHIPIKGARQLSILRISKFRTLQKEKEKKEREEKEKKEKKDKEEKEKKEKKEKEEKIEKEKKEKKDKEEKEKKEKKDKEEKEKKEKKEKEEKEEKEKKDKKENKESKEESKKEEPKKEEEKKEKEEHQEKPLTVDKNMKVSNSKLGTEIDPSKKTWASLFSISKFRKRSATEGSNSKPESSIHGSIEKETEKELKDHDIKDVKEDKESKTTKEIKEVKDIKIIKETKEIKDTKEVKDIKETKDTKNTKEIKDTKEIKEMKPTKEVKDIKETKDTKEIKETKEITDAKDNKETKDTKNTKDIKDTKEVKDTKEITDAKDIQDSIETMHINEIKEDSK